MPIVFEFVVTSNYTNSKQKLPIQPFNQPFTHPSLHHAAEQDPNYYHRKPVSSAHAIDLTSSPPKLSSKDSAALSPSGSVIHGRYGELPTTSTNGIPLEYLALLHPAAEGAAALRTVSEGATEGTLLIYGVTEPAALSALQLASSSNIAVIGVAGGVHSSQSEFLTMLESLTVEPGTIVPEEYAIVWWSCTRCHRCCDS